MSNYWKAFAGTGRWCAALLLLGPAQGKLAAANKQPLWLTGLVNQASPPQAAEVPAIVLFQEQHIVFENPQEWVETIRFAVRLLAKNSQDRAVFSLHYINRTDEVKHVTACLVRPDGSIKDFGEADWADVAVMDEKGLYSDFRVQSIRAGDHAHPGDVFGCEVTIRRRERFGETVWVPFASGLPAERIQVTLRAPKNFEGRLHWIGAAPEQLPEDPAQPGLRRWCWRDRPFEPAEAKAPTRPAHAVFIRLLRTDGAKGSGGTAGTGWIGIAQLAAQYQDAACNSSAGLTATARKLTEGLVAPADKLEVIGRFVQQCAYAALDKNTGFGFGFQPRLASKVLDARYGDCKDKVNLLRALLREIGITAYPVAVSAESPSEIDPAWPSLLQFNHVIAAIRVDADCVAPAAAEVSGLGRVLFFDPTSEHTPLGYLPWVLQDSQGLLCDPRGPGLVRLPKLEGDDRWRLHREADLVLDDNGLEGSVVLELHGEQAGGFRELRRQFKDSELRDKLSAVFTRQARDMKLVENTFSDNWAQDLVTLNLRFRSREFGQKMPGQLWVLPMNLFNPIGSPKLAETERRQPFVVTPIADEERLVLKWPAGYSAETVPADAVVRSEYGEYHSSFRVDRNAVICERRYSIRGATLSPAQYLKFRQFLLSVAKLDQRTLVLHKEDSK